MLVHHCLWSLLATTPAHHSITAAAPSHEQQTSDPKEQVYSHCLWLTKQSQVDCHQLNAYTQFTSLMFRIAIHF